jgi:hypothetical protein
LDRPQLPSKRPQQIVDVVVDDRAGPSRKGHHLVGVLAVHVGAVDREQHNNYQGCQKPSHARIVSPDGSDQVKPAKVAIGLHPACVVGWCSPNHWPMRWPQFHYFPGVGAFAAKEQ